MELKYAAGITLYHPEPNNVINIYEYSKCFDKVFVYDNTEIPNDSVAYHYSFPNNVFYYSGFGNCGLPYAFNFILLKCKEIDIDFICTLDQDSNFTFENITIIKKFINEKYDEWNKSVCIFAPYIDFGFLINNTTQEYEFKDWVITSGAFLNCKILEQYNLHYDENYFIDRVDADLCRQVVKKGLKIVVYNHSILHQQLGEESGHKHPNHVTFRHYYIFRDRLYYNKKFYFGIVRLFRNVSGTVNHCLLILLYENHKVEKIQMLFKAITDYRHKNFGKKNSL